MKKPSLLLLPLGLIAGALAFGTGFWLQTRFHPVGSTGAGVELDWLRREFKLTDTQFARVAELHNAYKPHCAELCQRISDRNQRLRDAVARTNVLTDEIKGLVAETGRTRDECRQAMLGHLYAVAGQMPPDSGQRYLQLMLSATCVLQETRSIDSIQPVQPEAHGSHSHHE